MVLKEDCENFWKGDFGLQYTNRNDLELLPSILRTWVSILERTDGDISSVFEFGTNSGLNLDALSMLLPKTSLNGVEINSYACEIANNKGYNVRNSSFYNLDISQKFDLVFTYTVLIHVPPDNLEEIYKKIFNLSSKYILVCEYFSRDPVEVNYRGHEGRLYKRDFASELINMFPSLKLLDYRFIWRNDKLFQEDDITYFLFMK